jgi:hypothetical protein
MEPTAVAGVRAVTLVPPAGTAAAAKSRKPQLGSDDSGGEFLSANDDARKLRACFRGPPTASATDPSISFVHHLPDPAAVLNFSPSGNPAEIRKFDDSHKPGRCFAVPIAHPHTL